MSLSTHVLDLALGRPAVGVPLTLYEAHGAGAAAAWVEIGTGATDDDGRCRTLLGEHSMRTADYKVRFDTGAYFAAQHVTGLYPIVEIVFTVRDPGEHFHIPLLLSANGYTTYRGS